MPPLPQLRATLLHKTKKDLQQSTKTITRLQNTLHSTNSQTQQSHRFLTHENHGLTKEVQRLSAQLAQRAILNKSAERQLSQMNDRSDRTESYLSDLLAKSETKSNLNETRLAEVENKYIAEVRSKEELSHRLRALEVQLEEARVKTSIADKEVKLLSSENAELRASIDELKGAGGGWTLASSTSRLVTSLPGSRARTMR